jgi:hypothetical protein
VVYRKNDDGTGGWHEPPYTWEEKQDMYRRMDGPQTIYRGPVKPADKQDPSEQPQPEEK